MQRFSLPLIAMLVLLTGCRMYGGYDSKELNIEALSVLQEQVATTAATAEAELALLSQAASADTELGHFEEVYSSLVNRHISLVEKFAESGQPASLKGSGRRIGAIISEMSIVSNGYNRVKSDIAELKGLSIPRSNTEKDLSYAVVPPFYRRIDINQDLSMRDVLSLN